MAKIKIKTKGMHCPSCEMLVVDSLEEIDGVVKAEASYKSGIIAVEFDDKTANENQIVDVIKKEGYEVV